MAKVVKVIELMSESQKSWEDAAQNAVREASRTLRNIRSLYVKDMTASVENGRITSNRLNSKVTLELEGDRGGKKK
jgi:flavin-binding protein dodecin